MSGSVRRPRQYAVRGDTSERPHGQFTHPDIDTPLGSQACGHTRREHDRKSFRVRSTEASHGQPSVRSNGCPGPLQALGRSPNQARIGRDWNGTTTRRPGATCSRSLQRKVRRSGAPDLYLLPSRLSGHRPSDRGWSQATAFVPRPQSGRVGNPRRRAARGSGIEAEELEEDAPATDEPCPASPRGRVRTSSVVVGSGTNPNTRRRLERLVSAWEQAKGGDAEELAVTPNSEPDVVSHPGRRNRTPLTEREVEAIRTARDRGESVLSIAKRFGIHRGTVWQYTRHRNSVA